ncbi:hypothetical protein [Nonomuraea sp. NPDC049695]|uniref:hypothetical protein n=1 Tax=Nonomuraea sp. NPDC049695 TaxID=3154734 RepID=UPI0034131F00
MGTTLCGAALGRRVGEHGEQVCGDAPRGACAVTGPQAAARRGEAGAGRTAAGRLPAARVCGLGAGHGRQQHQAATPTVVSAVLSELADLRAASPQMQPYDRLVMAGLRSWSWAIW